MATRNFFFAGTELMQASPIDHPVWRGGGVGAIAVVLTLFVDFASPTRAATETVCTPSATAATVPNR